VLNEYLRHITSDPLWFVVGMAAQVMFFLRFLVQWVVSERRRQSVIPVAFWHLSLAGGLLLLAYSIRIRDPVFTAGSLLGCFVYLRNLKLLRAEGPAPPAGV